MNRYHHLTEDEKATVFKAYKSGVTSWTLGLRFGISPNAILAHLQRAGIPRRQRSESYTRRVVNDGAFDAVGEHVSYWIGFLMADGCVYSPSHAIHLRLAIEDTAHVEKFRAFVGTTRRTRVQPSRGGNAQPQCWLSITSKQIVASLARFGVTDRKTYTACLQGGVENDRHCFRGLVDGDGHVSWLDDGHPRLNLAGSRQITEQFGDYCRAIVPTTSQPRKTGESWRFELEGQFAATMIRHLYSDCSISLDRKQAKADRIIRDYQPPKLCWKTIPTDSLLRLKNELGRWRFVAVRLGMSRTDVYALLRSRGLRP